MDALKKEVEELEKKEAEESTEVEETTEEVAEEETVEEATEETAEETTEQSDEDEADKLRKQEAYKERQKQKQESLKAVKQEAQPAIDLTAETPSEIEQLKTQMSGLQEIANQQNYDNAIKQAGRELEALEPEFREAFTDYDDMVDQALELTKMRLVASGKSESDADEYLRKEKILIADRAASQGKDPVAAIYKEAKDVIGVFDAYAEKNGYVKSGKKKTNLQAMREISKPNAMTGGAGQGSSATKSTFDELGDDDLEEIQGANIWDIK